MEIRVNYFIWKSAAGDRRIVGWVATHLIVVAMLVAGGCASSAKVPDRIAEDDLPATIRVDGPVVTCVHATGFQVYTCQAGADGKLAWVLKAPEAEFTGEDGLKGKHFEGPTWQSTNDGSSVVGRKIADAAAPEPGAVPWLLLVAIGHDEVGIFSDVTFIQRIHTSGGVAPPLGDAKAGDEIRVPYSADYFFYGSGATTQPTTASTSPSPKN